MAKFVVAGNALVITSELEVKALDMIQKYDPQALALYDEETKEILFKVSKGARGQVTQYGVQFDSANAEGKAMTTLMLDVAADTASEYVLDEFGGAFAKLEAVEAAAAIAYDTIKAARKSMAERIEVM